MRYPRAWRSTTSARDPSVRASRRADLKTGTTCNSNCVFCVIGDHLFTGDRTTEACIAELRESRKTCDDVVFTGAEVSIRPDFFTLVRAARQLGYQRIQIQTNGRMFGYREFCERTIAAGANEFSPSIHGHQARLHDGLTRAEGSFAQIVAAIEHLVALGQRVVTNTVITKQNARHLPELARMLVDLGVAQYQLAFPHPTGHAATYFGGVVPRMSEIAAHVHAALSIGRDAGVACMAEAIPFCHMQGHEDAVAELHIPPTEIVYDGYVVPDYAADRIARGKLRFAGCARCRFEPICEGPWKEYPARMGDAEFVAIPGARIVDTALVLDGRWRVLGRAAPEAVRGQGWRALCFVPEAGSPACSRQLRGLVRDLHRLHAAGIEVVVISPDGAEVQRSWATGCGAALPMISDGDRSLAEACAAVGRTSVLVDPAGTIAHLVIDVDVDAHAAQLLDALVRLRAPPRPLGVAEELVVIRRNVAGARP